MTTKDLMVQLKSEEVNTWFDLGIFMDKVRDNQGIDNPLSETITFEKYKKELSEGGIGFLTYQFAVDGVTVEIQKYSIALRAMLPDIKIHYLAGEFSSSADQFIDSKIKRHELKSISGFDNWPLYDDFFFVHLERGSKEYNRLIVKFWDEVIQLVSDLGTYIEKNDLRLLYLINVCSNPGNISLSLAIALLSENLEIPVINNNHDYYWEGGNKKIDIKTKGLRSGPRDFFFKNSHLGEVFSLVEVLFPWESRRWVNVNINRNQTDHLINVNGHNPANVCEIGTAVDTTRYTTLTKRKKIKAFIQVQAMLSLYKKNLKVTTAKKFIGQKDKKDQPLVIGWSPSSSFDFVNNNIVFLQPTRLMPRKRIEVGFRLIKGLFDSDAFTAKFKSNPDLTLTFLITGPIPMGQTEYTLTLIKLFNDLLKDLKPSFRSKVYLGFLFSEFDKPRFTSKYEEPVDIPELYNIASLIMLPSETEGRGLPLIEATACGIPIFCRRYYPENVYSEVIGEHLGEEHRLKVLEFDGKNISEKLIEKIISRVFFPQNYIDEVEHNKRVVENRYSINALQKNLDAILHRLYLQHLPNNKSVAITKMATDDYLKIISFRNKDVEYLINDKNRHYLPGFGRLAFMNYLKSLIDPSFFRVEEQQIRAMAMRFARKLVREDSETEELREETLHDFYNSVDNIFGYSKGEMKIRHDHSFSYRHRNKKYFPYQDLTQQELTGLINMLYNRIAKPSGNQKFKISPHFFTDWNLALFQLTNSVNLAIDDRKRLVEKLKANIPIGYFPGEYLKYELEFFVLQPIRARLNLKIEEELKEEHLKKHAKSLATVYVFCQEMPLGKWFTAQALEKYISQTDDSELKLLFKYGVCKIVRTKQWCVGVHFIQLGAKALKELRKIKKDKGILITNGDNAPVMTDIVDIDRFHIGKVEDEREIISRIMGIPIGDGFIQYVPAGLRTTLAYPTPVQTAVDFSEAMNSKLFNQLSNKLGEQKLLDLLKVDAEQSGTPIRTFLENLKVEIDGKRKKTDHSYQHVTGVYEDGYPWNGVLAKVKTGSKKWKFATHSLHSGTATVTKLIEAFDAKYKRKAKIAWNGGYILNPELVGKLGLPESYIGSPLGLLISDGKVLCPPLFNKPAFIIYKNGKMSIEKVHAMSGFRVETGNDRLEFSEGGYNKFSATNPSYFDLLYSKSNINVSGVAIVRLAGNVIKEIIKCSRETTVEIKPVGLTLSVPLKKLPKSWKIGLTLDINLKSSKSDRINWNNVAHAIEAGPMLIKNGVNCIDMKNEGWKSANSIATQAARLDFTDMRGPKIAVGLDKAGNVLVLTINGRIRESVGATHHDMATILLSFGAVQAMGFDPGGSSTLVMDGKNMNISPYNKEYEKDIYSLPPEPRAVANAIIGWTE
ncbi:MAG: hypothetical protein COB85_01265 [Bacteroidetes bacterium]|nr:MAG: hypothetical protein COB85_01265 [Bacteroidota bacterium]